MYGTRRFGTYIMWVGRRHFCFLAYEEKKKRKKIVFKGGTPYHTLLSLHWVYLLVDVFNVYALTNGKEYRLYYASENYGQGDKIPGKSSGIVFTANEADPDSYLSVARAFSIVDNKRWRKVHKISSKQSTSVRYHEHTAPHSTYSSI